MNENSTIVLDFDAVLHLYRQGWTGPEPLEPPVPGALDFVRWLLAQGYDVIISSTRASQADGLEGIRAWLRRYGFPDLTVTNAKPIGALYLDDRAVRFDGDFRAVQTMLSEGIPPSWVDGLDSQGS